MEDRLAAAQADLEKERNRSYSARSMVVILRRREAELEVKLQRLIGENEQAVIDYTKRLISRRDSPSSCVCSVNSHAQLVV